MNKIYNTYKASEGGFEKKWAKNPLLQLGSVNGKGDNLYNVNQVVKSFNRTSALALLESVREMAKEKEITPPSEHGGKFRLEQAYNQGVSSILSAIEQAEQLIKQ